MNARDVAMVRRILSLITFVPVCFLLNSCVMHYSSGPQDGNPTSLGSGRPRLIELKKNMSTCVAQYAIADEKMNNFYVEFKAENHHVFYDSNNPGLVDYMNSCAGQIYEGKDYDRGTISISRQEV